jgi:hypothetical protein
MVPWPHAVMLLLRCAFAVFVSRVFALNFKTSLSLPLFVVIDMAQKLTDFVTAYAQGEGFDQAFLDDVIKILLANEILTVKLLAKCNPSKLLHVKNGPQVSAGKCSFIVDMVESLKTEAPPE